MAPCVRVGQSENARFDAASSSPSTVATNHGKPPPPYSAGNGTDPQPAAT